MCGCMRGAVSVIKLSRVVSVIGLLLLCVSPMFAGSIPSTSGSWQQGPSLTTSRSFATATLLADGRVVFAGGKDASGNALASVDLLMPDGSIAAGPPMSTPRYGHSAVVLGDGRLLVAGGRSTNGWVLNSA